MRLFHKSVFILGLMTVFFSREGRSSSEDIIEEVQSKKTHPSKSDTFKKILSSELTEKQRVNLNKQIDEAEGIKDKFEFKINILDELCKKNLCVDADLQLRLLQNMVFFDINSTEQEPSVNEIRLGDYKVSIESINTLSNKMLSSKREELFEKSCGLKGFSSDLTIAIVTTLLRKKLYKDAADQYALILFANRDTPLNKCTGFIDVLQLLLEEDGILFLTAKKMSGSSELGSKISHESILKFKDHAITVLRKLRKMDDCDLIYDFTLLFCSIFLEAYREDIHANFINSAFIENPNSIQAKSLYANRILGPKIAYGISKNSTNQYLEENLQLYTDIIKCRRFQKAEYYENIGVLFIKKENYTEAKKYLGEARDKNPSDFLIRKNFATSLSLTGDFTGAIKELKAALTLPDVDKSLIEKDLILCLQKAGLTKEATQMITERTRSAIAQRSESHRTMVERIKREQRMQNEALDKVKSEEEKLKEQNELIDFNVDYKKHFEKSENSNITYNEEVEKNSNLKKEYLDITTKEKIKTHGSLVSHTETEQKPIEIPIKGEKEKKTSEEPKPLESLLKENSKNYNTVLDIFEVFTGGKKDAAVKISMTRLGLLWEALGGDFDRSKGKGSHTKLTKKNESSEGDGSDEPMIILANTTFLSRDQIRDLAQSLLDLGLYPKEMKETLIQKKWLEK